MTALLLLLLVPVVMWGAQAVLLKAQRAPIRWRIDLSDAPRGARTVSRAVTQLCLAAVIVACPLLRGESVWSCYGRFLPGQAAPQLLEGAAASVFFLCVLFGAWLAGGQLQIDVHQSRNRWIRRLALLLPTAMFGAFVEELLFRGVLLADLLRSFPDSAAAAAALSALIFAAAHYVRRVKRRWTFPGHLMLGLLLGVAFIRTQFLWLPIGLHAGGMVMIMGGRPFFRYRGPAWLTGASIFPFAGVAGLAGLAILTIFIVRRYGV